jgi:hypothetical protein
MGIGEIINQTASEVYRSTQAVVPLTTAHSTPASEPASISHPLINKAELPPLGGGHPLPFRKIFSDRNYTRYIYIGNTHYASREEIERNHTEDAQYINKQLEGLLPQQQQQQQQQQQPSATAITQIELLLFKGARHMKRGSGITRCPFTK